MEDNDDVQLSLAYIGKIKNIADSLMSTIDKTVLLITATMDKKKLDVGIRRSWTLQWVYVKQIDKDAKKPMIF